MSKNPSKTAVAILGATGSIGTATVDVLQNLGAPWRVVAISGHSRVAELLEIAGKVKPTVVAGTCLESAEKLREAEGNFQLRFGPDALIEIANTIATRSSDHFIFIHPQKLDVLIVLACGCRQEPGTAQPGRASLRRDSSYRRNF